MRSQDPHIANIFSAEEEDCLSLEQMTAYQQGQLVGQAKHHVERHLLNCELCAITIESIAENGPQSIATGAAEVADRAWDRVQAAQGRKRRGAYFWVASAASIVLLVTVGYFSFRGPSQSQMEKAFAEAIEQTAPMATPTLPHDNLAMEDASGKPATGDVQDDPKSVTATSRQSDLRQDQPKAILAEALVPSPKPTPSSGKESNKSPMTAAGKSEIKVGEHFASKDAVKGGMAANQPALDETRSPVKGTIAASENAEIYGGADDFEGDADNQITPAFSGPIIISEANTARSERIVNADFVVAEAQLRDRESPQKKMSRLEGKAKTDSQNGVFATNSKPSAPIGRVLNDRENEDIASAPVAVGQRDASSFDQGIIAYKEGDYREAAKNLRKASEETPSNLEAHIFAADAFLRISQPQAALFHIDRVLAVPGNSHIEDAEWYKALAFLQLKEGNKAKKQLEKVVSAGGKYKAQAEKALAELK